MLIHSVTEIAGYAGSEVPAAFLKELSAQILHAIWKFHVASTERKV